MKLYQEAFRSCGGLGISGEADIICKLWSLPPAYPRNSGKILPESCGILFSVYIICDGSWACCWCCWNVMEFEWWIWLCWEWSGGWWCVITDGCCCSETGDNLEGIFACCWKAVGCWGDIEDWCVWEGGDICWLLGWTTPWTRGYIAYSWTSMAPYPWLIFP